MIIRFFDWLFWPWNCILVHGSTVDTYVKEAPSDGFLLCKEWKKLFPSPRKERTGLETACNIHLQTFSCEANIFRLCLLGKFGGWYFKTKKLFTLAASLGRRFENRQRICCAIPHVAAVRIRDADRCPWVSLSTDVQNHTFAIAVKNSYTVVSKSGQSPFHTSYEFERRHHPHTTKSHRHIPPRSHSLTDRTIVWERLAVVYHNLWK